ncbi:MAG: efflux RND transporter periplasmic adaptor subunit [Deltaproteobacteria bacterium]|nr:efflux RND transporter periplasmic adaptor subunit [Deltaproteobacteria bacterium]
METDTDTDARVDAEASVDTDPEPKPEPKQRPRWIVWVMLGLVVAGIAVGGSAVFLVMRGRGDSHAGAAAPDHKPLYQCPMHPAITSDHPGDCPICGMKLVLMKQDQPAPSQTAAIPAKRGILFYRSPMDPKQTSPTPRKDEMGMDYVPVYSDEAQGNGGRQVEGLATVTIDPARQQLIGLRTAPVTRGPVAESWRTVGRVEVDPTRVRKTNVKIEGYIERMYVDFVGRPVRRGEPLFSIFSPSLLATENEYLLAVQMKDALLKGGAFAGNADSLIASARRKLELWDVPAKEIERLEQTRQPSKSLTVVSPIAGVVTAKNVVEGARVNAGDTPYEITDLGVVWVLADAYETDLPRVRVGMQASLTVQAYPDQPFEGKVVFIDPLLDPKTRTTKVHMHFPNPTGVLMPEMFGDVTLEGTQREGLRIPTDAVVPSGVRNVVFVALGDGKFEPREVRLGARTGDQVEVLGGITEGEQVVMRANFLVDSESQLRSSLAGIGGK